MNFKSTTDIRNWQAEAQNGTNICNRNDRNQKRYVRFVGIITFCGRKQKTLNILKNDDIIKTENDTRSDNKVWK